MYPGIFDCPRWTKVKADTAQSLLKTIINPKVDTGESAEAERRRKRDEKKKYFCDCFFPEREQW